MQTLEFPVEVKPKLKAWQLIEDPKDWCRGSHFKTYVDRTAMCAIEAINEAYKGDIEGCNRAIDRLLPYTRPYSNIPSWNDHVSHRTVVEGMRRADV